MCKSSTNLSKSWSLDCVHSWCYSQLPLKLPTIFLQTHLELIQKKSKPMPEQQQKNCPQIPQIPNPHKVIKFLQPQTHNCTHIKFFTTHTSTTKKTLYPIIPNHPQTPNPLLLYTYSLLLKLKKVNTVE